MKRIIGRLMFLANNEGMKDAWYELKEMLCIRYGVHDGYDVQTIDGKECYYCEGTGIFRKYTYSGDYIKQPCFRCVKGWYKQPMYVLLERIKVGNYIFHKPIKKRNTPLFHMEVNIPTTVSIHGYVEYRRQKYGWMAFSALYIWFNPKGYFRFVKGLGSGWRISWWLPRNYLYNIMHLIKKRSQAMPFRGIRLWLNKRVRIFSKTDTQIDDLPF
jgi:hypothetical protein